MFGSQRTHDFLSVLHNCTHHSQCYSVKHFKDRSTLNTISICLDEILQNCFVEEFPNLEKSCVSKKWVDGASVEDQNPSKVEDAVVLKQIFDNWKFLNKHLKIRNNNNKVNLGNGSERNKELLMSSFPLEQLEFILASERRLPSSSFCRNQGNELSDKITSKHTPTKYTENYRTSATVTARTEKSCELERSSVPLKIKPINQEAALPSDRLKEIRHFIEPLSGGREKCGPSGMNSERTNSITSRKNRSSGIQDINSAPKSLSVINLKRESVPSHLLHCKVILEKRIMVCHHAGAGSKKICDCKLPRQRNEAKGFQGILNADQLLQSRSSTTNDSISNHKQGKSPSLIWKEGTVGKNKHNSSQSKDKCDYKTHTEITKRQNIQAKNTDIRKETFKTTKTFDVHTTSTRNLTSSKKIKSLDYKTHTRFTKRENIQAKNVCTSTKIFKSPKKNKNPKTCLQSQTDLDDKSNVFSVLPPKLGLNSVPMKLEFSKENCTFSGKSHSPSLSKLVNFKIPKKTNGQLQKEKTALEDKTNLSCVKSVKAKSVEEATPIPPVKPNKHLTPLMNGKLNEKEIHSTTSKKVVTTKTCSATSNSNTNRLQSIPKLKSSISCSISSIKHPEGTQIHPIKNATSHAIKDSESAKSVSTKPSISDKNCSEALKNAQKQSVVSVSSCIENDKQMIRDGGVPTNFESNPRTSRLQSEISVDANTSNVQKLERKQNESVLKAEFTSQPSFVNERLSDCLKFVSPFLASASENVLVTVNKLQAKHNSVGKPTSRCHDEKQDNCKLLTLSNSMISVNEKSHLSISSPQTDINASTDLVQKLKSKENISALKTKLTKQTSCYTDNLPKKTQSLPNVPYVPPEMTYFQAKHHLNGQLNSNYYKEKYNFDKPVNSSTATGKLTTDDSVTTINDKSNQSSLRPLSVIGIGTNVFQACKKDNNSELKGKFTDLRCFLNEKLSKNTKSVSSFSDSPPDNISITVTNHLAKHHLSKKLSSSDQVENMINCVNKKADCDPISNSSVLTEKRIVRRQNKTRGSANENVVQQICSNPLTTEGPCPTPKYNHKYSKSSHDTFIKDDKRRREKEVRKYESTPLQKKPICENHSKKSKYDWIMAATCISLKKYKFNRYPVSCQAIRGKVSHSKCLHDARICLICRNERDKRILNCLRKRRDCKDGVFYDAKANILMGISKYQAKCHKFDCMQRGHSKEHQKITKVNYLKEKNSKETAEKQDCVPTGKLESGDQFSALVTKTGVLKKKIEDELIKYKSPEKDSIPLCQLDNLENYNLPSQQLPENVVDKVELQGSVHQSNMQTFSQASDSDLSDLHSAVRRVIEKMISALEEEDTNNHITDNKEVKNIPKVCTISDSKNQVAGFTSITYLPNATSPDNSQNDLNVNKDLHSNSRPSETLVIEKHPLAIACSTEDVSNNLSSDLDQSCSNCSIIEAKPDSSKQDNVQCGVENSSYCKTSLSNQIGENEDTNESPHEDLYSSEKVDIDNPDWEKYRNLDTDQARYETVRNHWGTQDAPNPHQNLTVSNYRKKRVCTQMVTERNRKRKAADEINNIPKKRLCLIPSTFLQLNELEDVKRNYTLEVRELKENSIRQENAAFENFTQQARDIDNRIFRNSRSFMPAERLFSINRFLSGEKAAVHDRYNQLICMIRNRFEDQYHNLTSIYHLKHSQVQSRLEEIQTFDKFYDGLQKDGQNTTVISEEQKATILLTHTLMENYCQIYGDDM